MKICELKIEIMGAVVTSELVLNYNGKATNQSPVVDNLPRKTTLGYLPKL